MPSNVVDAYELAERTRGAAFDIRVDSDVPSWHRRKNGAANALGRWRTTYQWNPATERVEMVAMVDTASAANLAGTIGL
jgi:hypothetical protein